MEKFSIHNTNFTSAILFSYVQQNAGVWRHYRDYIAQYLMYFNVYIIIRSSKWIKFRGITYKKGCVMATVSPEPTIENLPVFNTIEKLYILDGNQVYFYVRLHETKEFNHHYMCYFVVPTNIYKLLPLESFISHLPLHIHKLNIPTVKFCIVVKFHLCI